MQTVHYYSEARLAGAAAAKRTYCRGGRAPSGPAPSGRKAGSGSFPRRLINYSIVTQVPVPPAGLLLLLQLRVHSRD